MSELIPYDEMRRLCGLPDMQTLDMLAGIRKYGLNHFLNIGIQMGWFDDVQVPAEATHVTIGGKPPGWTSPPKPLRPKPKQAPPMWANDPARTRRTAFGPTRRVK